MYLKKDRFIIAAVAVFVAAAILQGLVYGQTPSPPPGYVPTIVGGEEEYPENFECPPDGEVPVGWGEIEPSEFWLQMCAHCLPESTPLPPSATQTIEALTPQPTITPDPNTRWVKCMSPMMYCNPLMQEEPQFILRYSETKHVEGGAGNVLYFDNGYIDWKVNPAHAVSGWMEEFITLNTPSTSPVTVSWKIMLTRVEGGEVQIASGVAIANGPVITIHVIRDINYGVYNASGLHYVIWFSRPVFGLSHGDFTINAQYLIAESGDDINWEYVESYCSRVHWDDFEDDDAFSWDGIDFGEKSCIDLGPWEASILGWDIEVPYIAYICAQDVSISDVVIFGVSISIEVFLVILMVAWIIRNLFIS